MTIARTAAVVVMLLFCATRADAATCSLSTTAISFGAYSVFASAPADSTGTVVLYCSGGARNLSITISRGDASTVAARRMVKGPEQLFYNLYRDAARNAIWGDGTGGARVHIANPPNNTDIPLTIYGRVPAGQDVSAGAYADSVTVTVNY